MPRNCKNGKNGRKWSVAVSRGVDLLNTAVCRLVNEIVGDGGSKTDRRRRLHAARGHAARGQFARDYAARTGGS